MTDEESSTRRVQRSIARQTALDVISVCQLLDGVETLNEALAGHGSDLRIERRCACGSGVMRADPTWSRCTVCRKSL